MISSYQRSDRVADVIKRELAAIISREIKDPRVDFITITHVRVTSDLRNARVFYTSIDKEEKAVAAGLKKASGFIQRKLGARLQLRYIPHITFVHDASVAEGSRMDHILKGIEEELEAKKDS